MSDEDFLTEDPEIPSQKIVLLSFLSPEKVLANKDQYFFREFLRDYEVQWRTNRLEAWMAEQLAAVNSRLEALAGKMDSQDLSGVAQEIRGHEIRVDRFVEEFKEYCRKNTKEATSTQIKEAYDDFLFKNSAKLEDEFFKENEFRTTIRGIKIRGVFPSEAEAAVRAKRLQKSDPTMNIYQGAVGKWMAWEPDPNKVMTQEYANEQLNTLMKKYNENEEAREQFYTEQKRQRLAGAKKAAATVEDNAGAAASTGEPAETKVSESVATGSESTTKEPEAAASLFGGGAAGSYDGLFSGPADLAIQRKMEREKKQ
jgi:hypothetical protein